MFWQRKFEKRKNGDCIISIISIPRCSADILPQSPAYIVKIMYVGDFIVKDYIEERAVEIADYIIETKATVRQTAKQFGISKSTVHMVVII